MKLNFILSLAAISLPKYFSYCYYYANNIWFRLQNINTLISCCYLLKYTTLIKLVSLYDICVIDYPQNSHRFYFIYNIWSFRYMIRGFLSCKIVSNIFVSSVNSIFSGATWIEREIWDMFGILFQSHLDLRRILTDYGFVGHPLRKDFPLSGYIELAYLDSTNSLSYTEIELSQDFRIFLFTSPWEDITLPKLYNRRVVLI